jgi:ABC-type transport system involved in cytochrome c biogenesis permease subunit
MDHLRGTGLTSREARFNRANYFGKAKVFYILAFFLSMGALVSGSTKLRLAAWVPLVCALFLHVVGICWRIYLTARPPVTNLYGTFLFVGLVCLLLALLVEYFQKDALGIFAGSFIAITFLFVADRFGAEGDTLNKVVAVLASNFWLSTHVLAVTTGYAGVWIAGVFGHLWLLFKLMGKPKALMESVRLPLEGLLGFGLTFAFLGTMLGGVWADQSWGRFWGWDPKENGALLIVLWTAALYHARVAGMIGEKGMAAGSVGGCIMVMVAWLGVNLLGVGLHSYGFTTAMKSLFVGYILFEVIFLVVCLGLIRLQEQRTSVQPA